MNIKAKLVASFAAVTLTAGGMWQLNQITYNNGYEDGRQADARENAEAKKREQDRIKQENIANDRKRLATLVEQKKYDEALPIAAKMRDIKTVLELLNRGANPNVYSIYNGTALSQMETY